MNIIIETGASFKELAVYQRPLNFLKSGGLGGITLFMILFLEVGDVISGLSLSVEGSVDVIGLSHAELMI
ncbi:MAG: hypothetical protein Q4A61_06740 [Porphyromonadaceae bacterium]|nr:hypothetical protein [Porphyromonadaceae bacterium]